MSREDFGIFPWSGGRQTSDISSNVAQMPEFIHGFHSCTQQQPMLKLHGAIGFQIFFVNFGSLCESDANWQHCPVMLLLQQRDQQHHQHLYRFWSPNHPLPAATFCLPIIAASNKLVVPATKVHFDELFSLLLVFELLFCWPGPLLLLCSSYSLIMGVITAEMDANESSQKKEEDKGGGGRRIKFFKCQPRWPGATRMIAGKMWLRRGFFRALNNVVA